jgi:hypothetical protein
VKITKLDAAGPACDSYPYTFTHQVIMSIEADDLREEKLKQLNSLVGALSFPPPPSGRPSNFNIW